MSLIVSGHIQGYFDASVQGEPKLLWKYLAALLLKRRLISIWAIHPYAFNDEERNKHLGCVPELISVHTLIYTKFILKCGQISSVYKTLMTFYFINKTQWLFLHGRKNKYFWYSYVTRKNKYFWYSYVITWPVNPASIFYIFTSFRISSNFDILTCVFTSLKVVSTKKVFLICCRAQKVD